MTMWHHFAAFSVSITMFGLTLGAVIVYLKLDRVDLERVPHIFGCSALLLSIFIVASFVFHISFPFSLIFEARSLLILLGNFVFFAIPFTLCGVCLCLYLSKFPKQFSVLYFYDLVGAGLGCLATVLILKLLSPPSVIFLIAAFSSLIALGSLRSVGAYRIICLLVFAIGLSLAVINEYCSIKNQRLFQIRWAKGKEISKPVYEKWNSYSRVSITDEIDVPFGWGLSSETPIDNIPKQLYLALDAGASTPLTEFQGDFHNLEYLKYDVTNLAHYISAKAKMLIIGSGGGRDVLSALIFGQESILAVEMNEIVLDALNNIYGDLTGHLDQRPEVTFVNDEARSFVERITDSFDLIQLSLVDTWAATAAGAMALSENSLYTVEAWESYLDRLTDNGILSVSRIYGEKYPYEAYRLASLARESLLKIGITEPEKHVLMIANNDPILRPHSSLSIVNLLLKNTAFNEEEIEEIFSVSQRLNFSVLYSPKSAEDPRIRGLLSKGHRNLSDALHADLSAPRDDRPFFFSNRLSANFLALLAGQTSRSGFNGLVLLHMTLCMAFLASYCFIILPLRRTTQINARQRLRPMLVYFICLGIGFMLVEISLLQRCSIYLGHPVYSLAVVLSTLLIASGAGSATVGWLFEKLAVKRLDILILAILSIMLLLAGMFVPKILGSTRAFPVLMRVGIVVSSILPIAFVMGMALPIGIREIDKWNARYLPYFWGINGSASVCGAFIGALASLEFGISVLFWLGMLCYLGALSSRLVWQSSSNNSA